MSNTSGNSSCMAKRPNKVDFTNTFNGKSSSTRKKQAQSNFKQHRKQQKKGDELRRRERKC